MKYQEIPACGAVAEHIECLWTLESAGSVRCAEPIHILPDGCMELILNFGEPFRRHYGRGQVEVQPREFVVGQMTSPVFIQPWGKVDVMGVRFRAGGAAAFFEPPAEEMTGRMVRLADVAGELQRELHRAMESARTPAERAAKVTAVFARGAARKAKNGNVVRAARAMERHGGSVSISRLAGEMGISARQLERQFRAVVGIGPKVLSRILRFQRVFQTVARLPEMNWAAVAHECGYFDQSHLIRDFHSFAGTTPPALFSRLNELTEHFTRKRRE